MQIPGRAALAALLFVALPAYGSAQSSQPSPAAPAVGSLFTAPVIRDLPLGDNVYSILENTQSEVIADRFNSGGLNVGGDTRVGGFLGSWSQTHFRIGDVDVSDPTGGGAALLFPDAALWDRVSITTGLMPTVINTPGLAVTFEPLRGGDGWTRVFTGNGAGGGMASGAPANQPIPVARLKEYGRGSAVVSGPLSARTRLAAAATWARGLSYRREQLPANDSTTASAFANLSFTPSAGREFRALGWVQRSEAPFENWMLVRDPAATTDTNAVHVQSTWESRSSSGASWRVFGGFTERSRTNTLGAATLYIERIVDGPVQPLVDSMADATVRRLSAGARAMPAAAAGSAHRLEYGVTVDHASSQMPGVYAGTVRETVNSIPARVWSYNAIPVDSSRSTTTLAAYAGDAITLSPRLSLDAGVRAELVRGGAEGAAQTVSWLNLLPHAYLRIAFSDRRSLTLGYARSGNALTHNWLAYGDPGAPTARVVAAAAPNTLVSRVGPGINGNTAFSQVDGDLKRPQTDELVVGWEKRRSAATRYTLTGIARWEHNLLGVVNTGVPLSGYSTISLPDAGKDLVDPADDRNLLVYNRLPSTFGQDTYLLTNPDQQAARAFALRMSIEHATERLFVLFGATASAAQGSGGNRGYGPLENDQDQPGELFTNPNAASYSYGRLFSDRAFTIKWTTLYRFPGDFTVGGIARYQDGQPFSRMVVVPTLNQGAEGVQSYPNAGSRYTFTGTFDLRVQKGFRVGGTRLDAIFDAYNLFTRNNEVEEYVVSGPGFRTPTAIQPPHAVHVGLRFSF
ncbi:MAG: hypothetical protein AB7H96_06085 [Vicinamibacterales bacterium]